MLAHAAARARMSARGHVRIVGARAKVDRACSGSTLLGLEDDGEARWRRHRASGGQQRAERAVEVDA